MRDKLDVMKCRKMEAEDRVMRWTEAPEEYRRSEESPTPGRAKR